MPRNALKEGMGASSSVGEHLHFDGGHLDMEDEGARLAQPSFRALENLRRLRETLQTIRISQVESNRLNYGVHPVHRLRLPWTWKCAISVPQPHFASLCRVWNYWLIPILVSNFLEIVQYKGAKCSVVLLRREELGVSPRCNQTVKGQAFRGDET